MKGIIGALLGDLWPYIAAAIGTAVTLATAWLVGRKAGAAGVKAKQAQSTIKAHEVRNEVENRIAVDRDAKQRLRDKWQE